MAVTRFVVRGAFRPTLQAFITMSQRAERLNTKKPQFNLFTTGQLINLNTLIEAAKFALAARA